MLYKFVKIPSSSLSGAFKMVGMIKDAAWAKHRRWIVPLELLLRFLAEVSTSLAFLTSQSACEVSRHFTEVGAKLLGRFRMIVLTCIA